MHLIGLGHGGGGFEGLSQIDQNVNDSQFPAQARVGTTFRRAGA